MEINRKIKSKKLNITVDLSAMVSISFLLIIFFMVVGELSKPKMVALSLPENGDISCSTSGCFSGERTYTILLDDNDKIITYLGYLQTPLQSPKKFQFGKESIRKELLSINKRIHEYSGKPQNGVIVIIKPSKKSNFGNLVNILDEMKIANIDSYSIINYYTPEEAKLLAVNKS